MLAIVLGIIGAHKFYLGRPGLGLVYFLLSVLLCWTIIIPVIVGIIAVMEGIYFLTFREEAFLQKYALR